MVYTSSIAFNESILTISENNKLNFIRELSDILCCIFMFAYNSFLPRAAAANY